MARIYTNDLAAILMVNYGIGRLEALRFLEAFVETIQEGVTNDRLVKIKGLGTFKVVDVDARKSVNVNTGESVVIGGHPKLTFTPETALKELINKPFSAFETVILNDGVTFDSLDSLTPDPSPKGEGSSHPDTEEEPVVEEPLVEETVAEEEPVVEDTAVEEEAVVEEQVVEEPVAEEAAVEVPTVSALLNGTDVQNETEEENVEPSRHRWWLWVLCGVAGCALMFFVGYWAGHRQSAPVSVQEEPSQQVPAAPIDSVTTAGSADSIGAAASTGADSIDVAAASTEGAAVSPATAQSSEEDDYLKYEAMDERVRRGAYNIIGTAEVIQAREGDTSRKIARRTLGDGMECYIEVYNGIDGNTVLKEGQEIKMPKLRVKKAARSKFRRK